MTPVFCVIWLQMVAFFLHIDMLSRLGDVAGRVGGHAT
jgi:hypothetical protein